MIILLALTVLITTGTIALIIFSQGELGQKGALVKESAIKVKKSENRGRKLEQIKKQLDKIKDVKVDIKKMTSNEEKNIYQEDIINTIKDLAQKSGLALISINFNDVENNGGVKTASLNLSFKSRMNYSNLMNFIALTESSLLRMQITNLSITNIDGEQNKGVVNVSNIQLKVYLK